MQHGAWKSEGSGQERILENACQQKGPLAVLAAGEICFTLVWGAFLPYWYYHSRLAACSWSWSVPRFFRFFLQVLDRSEAHWHCGREISAFLQSNAAFLSWPWHSISTGPIQTQHAAEHIRWQQNQIPKTSSQSRGGQGIDSIRCLGWQRFVGSKECLEKTTFRICSGLRQMLPAAEHSKFRCCWIESAIHSVCFILCFLEWTFWQAWPKIF